MDDLSQYHHMITDLFPFPSSEKEMEKYKLSKEEVDHFHKYGYLAGIDLLDNSQVEVLRNALAEISDAKHPLNSLFYEFNTNESTDPNKLVFHALGQWRLSKAFHDVIWHPRFLMACKQLLGGSVRFWHDQIFSKPAHHGGVVAWHQDYSYWTRTIDMNHLTCWIGLDDSFKSNGCLQYIPGSHKWGLLEKPVLTGKMDALKASLSPDQADALESPVAIELEAGQCSFHHPLLVHGSFENTSDKPRRAFVLNVLKDGVVSDSEEPLLGDVGYIPKGEKIGGQFYPLIMK